MNPKSKIILASILIVFSFAVIALPFGAVFAQTSGGDTGLVPCGTKANPEPCNECHFIELIQDIAYFLYFRIVPAVALLLFTIAGFLILLGGDNPISAATGTSGSSGTVSTGRQIFKTTVIGIVIIYTSFMLTNFVLRTVAGEDNVTTRWFDKISCTPTSIGAGSGESITPAPSSSTVGPDEYRDAEARKELEREGITTTNFPPCDTVPAGTSCSSFEGVKKKTIDEVLRLRNDCQCQIQANDATGPNHTPGSSHAKGFKIDLQATNNLSSYIRDENRSGFRRIADRTFDGAEQYQSPSGAIYAFEPSKTGGQGHWDIAVL